MSSNDPLENCDEYETFLDITDTQMKSDNSILNPHLIYESEWNFPDVRQSLKPKIPSNINHKIPAQTRISLVK